ncbi:ferritin-like domain-containing protein [Streptomyces sp. ST1015]|uniref:ferritin-like domain-containing protein n=1 Tax=unclassified Streptomyces TaxID=2593676 RepID=UPI000DD5E16D|nr:ferritin-like domain-containing protein [Streptomyces sp. ST1015]QZZ30526.1 ferritin-like domain-containing protein [Streptomyces sp. ST1015]
MTTPRIALLAPTTAASPAEELTVPAFGDVAVDRPAHADWKRYLHELDPSSDLAAVWIDAGAEPLPSVRALRAHARFDRTRVYVVEPGTAGPVPGWAEALDVEDIVRPSAVAPGGLTASVELALRAHRALMADALYTDYYLDMTFNRIFDWFETTRWDWTEVDLDRIDHGLLDERTVDFLTEAAVIEFGTLPGAHNFLREWQGEASFSSWALQWGAEESRHSLVQARYLDRIGVKLRSKHALYKREPYPQGDVRSATLMMNVISESRASALYKALAAHAPEPVIRKIWRLLARDEARHCRAFSVFLRELCDGDPAARTAALSMAYIWLADRRGGVKHPAGLFYPHSTSSAGIRRIETIQHDSVDSADAKVMSIVRLLADDDSLETPRDIKAKLRTLPRRP